MALVQVVDRRWEEDDFDLECWVVEEGFVPSSTTIVPPVRGRPRCVLPC
jgi:hypothetical protein